MPGSAAQAARSPRTGISSPRSRRWTSAQVGSRQKSSEQARIELWCVSGPAGSTTSFGFLLRPPQVRFSDNYLDLRDGEVAEIAVRGLTEDIGDDQLRAISGLTR